VFRSRLLAARRARFFDDVLAPALAEARRLGIDGEELVELVRAAMERADAAHAVADA